MADNNNDKSGKVNLTILPRDANGADAKALFKKIKAAHDEAAKKKEVEHGKEQGQSNSG